MKNAKLLSTAIMIEFGIDGHGKCLSQSIIANEVLKKMGYKSRVVGGYHITMFSAEDEDYFVCHAPTNKLDTSGASNVTEMFTDDGSRVWYHCWVETDDKIIDVNLHSITKKEYVDINNWSMDEVRQGREYYMPTTYDLGEPVDSKKIQNVIDTYKKLLTMIPMIARTEEGPILIDESGGWSPYIGYKMNKNIQPNTKAIIANPNVMRDVERILETV